MKTPLLTLISRLGCGALLATLVACSGVTDNAGAPSDQVQASAPSASAEVAMPTPVKVAMPAPVKAATPVSSTLRQQLVAEIGNAACDTNAQCRTLPLGHRSCGGPESYLAYSTKTGDAATIQRLGAQDTAARKLQDAQSGGMSICQMVMDPGATCQAGRCITGNASGAALPTR